MKLLISLLIGERMSEWINEWMNKQTNYIYLEICLYGIFENFKVKFVCLIQKPENKHSDNFQKY